MFFIFIKLKELEEYSIDINVNENKKKGRYTGKGKGTAEGKDSMSTRQGLNDLLGEVALAGRNDEPEPKAYRQRDKRVL